MVDHQELEEIFSKIDWEDFKRYLYRRYSRNHAKNCFLYLRKYGLKVLKDPLVLRELSYYSARHVLESYTSLEDYLDLKGVELVVNRRKLKKYMPPKPLNLDLFEWVEQGQRRLIDQAIDQLVFNPRLKGLHRNTAFIAFYTGLRGPEIRYLIMNADRLRSINLDYGVSIVELNYNRVKKKAYLTMLPTKLYEHVKGIGYIGEMVSKRLQEKGVSVKLMRKVHRAILSRTMDEAEIDLLQGRLTSVLVRYYTKHLLDIAEKYHKAYQPYYKLLKHLINPNKHIQKNNNNHQTKNAGGGIRSSSHFEEAPDFYDPPDEPTYLLFVVGGFDVKHR